MASKKRVKLKSFLRMLIRFSIYLTVLFLLVTWVQVAVVRYVNPPFTFAMIYDRVRHLVESKPYLEPRYIWKPLMQISPHFQRAVLAAEDQRFLNHHGFDAVEIRNALEDFLQEQQFRGASTLSMQTARTVYLLPTRSIIRKALEAYYTLLIELLWSKKRIMEVYLNTVDWGTRIMGAEAASRTYFNRKSREISPQQAALLAAILPSPHRLSPVKPNRYVRSRARRILADMHLMPVL